MASENGALSNVAASSRNLTLQIGSFLIRLRLFPDSLTEEFANLYSHYPVYHHDALTDFEIEMGPERAWRGFLESKVKILVDQKSLFQPQPRRLAIPMLESTMNLVLARRTTRYLLLHAAVVERDGRAVLLPGVPGAGKSTLCAALVERGWRLLSDEFTMVRLDDGRIQPHPRPISLKNNSIELIANRYAGARLSRPYEGTIKGTVAFLRAPNDAVARAQETAAPVLTIFPSYRAGVRLDLAPLVKAEAFLRLVDNSANYFTLMKAGFDTLAGLIETCGVYSFTYSDLDEAIAKIDELMALAPNPPIFHEIRS